MMARLGKRSAVCAAILTSLRAGCMRISPGRNGMLLLQLVGKAHSPVFHGRRVGGRAKRFDRRVRRRLYYRGIAVTIRARILCRATRQNGAQGNSKSNQYTISQCDDVSWSVLAERH